MVVQQRQGKSGENDEVKVGVKQNIFENLWEELHDQVTSMIFENS